MQSWRLLRKVLQGDGSVSNSTYQAFIGLISVFVLAQGVIFGLYHFRLVHFDANNTILYIFHFGFHGAVTIGFMTLLLLTIAKIQSYYDHNIQWLEGRRSAFEQSIQYYESSGPELAELISKNDIHKYLLQKLEKKYSTDIPKLTEELEKLEEKYELLVKDLKEEKDGRPFKFLWLFPVSYRLMRQLAVTLIIYGGTIIYQFLKEKSTTGSVSS